MRRDHRSMTYRITLALLVVTSLGAAGTQELEDYCSRAEKFGFSGAVLVAKDGKILLQKGYGYANRAQQVANTERTLFEIASATKPFTAAAILKLEEQGKLSTDDPIGKHLPGVPAGLQKVTVYHLLTHTSGMPRTAAGGRGPNLAAAVRAYLAPGQARKAGEQFAYWNGGYALLAGIVERVTGGTYMDYCRKHLFAPAGMQKTGFTGDTHLNDEPMASGYSDGRAVRTAVGHPYRSYGWQYRGMGGIVTSVLDLYQWDRALYGDKVLSAKTKKKYFKPFLGKYACGWSVVETPRKTRRITHGGDVRGFHTYFARFPDEDAVVIVTGNVDGIPMWSVGGSLESILFDEERKWPVPPKTVQLKAAQLEALAGTYELSAGHELVVRPDGEAILVGAVGQRAVDLLQARTRFDEHPDRFKRESRIARDVVEGVATGDVEVLRGVMMRGIPESWPDAVKRSIWPKHVEQWGAFRSVRVIGAGPAGRGRVRIILALAHAEGTPRCRVELQNGRLAIFDLKGPEFLESARCLPVSRERFVRFAWVGPSPPPLRFERKGRKVAAVVIKPVFGPAVRCKRIDAR